MWETSGGRVTRTPLAIAGDRLALELFRWHAREDVPAFEVDIVLLIEVDEQGRFIRIVAFDPANRAAASTELGESWVRLQGGEASSNAEVRVWRAWNAHDRERLLEALPADFYIDDRRRTGVGKIHGAEAWVDSVVAIWELSSDIHVEALYSIAQIDDATLYVCRWAGSYAEGSQFEALFPQISVRRGGILMGMELFELEDLDLAKARFESLATNERKSDVGG
jgi:hypothetical protein